MALQARQQLLARGEKEQTAAGAAAAAVSGAVEEEGAAKDQGNGKSGPPAGYYLHSEAAAALDALGGLALNVPQPDAASPSGGVVGHTVESAPAGSVGGTMTAVVGETATATATDPNGRQGAAAEGPTSPAALMFANPIADLDGFLSSFVTRGGSKDAPQANAVPLAAAAAGTVTEGGGADAGGERKSERAVAMDKVRSKSKLAHETKGISSEAAASKSTTGGVAGILQTAISRLTLTAPVTGKHTSGTATTGAMAKAAGTSGAPSAATQAGTPPVAEIVKGAKAGVRSAQTALSEGLKALDARVKEAQRRADEARVNAGKAFEAGATNVQGTLKLAESHAKLTHAKTARAVGDSAKAMGAALEGGKRIVDVAVVGAVAGAAKAVSEKVDGAKKATQANVSNTLNEGKAKLSEHIATTVDKSAAATTARPSTASRRVGSFLDSLSAAGSPKKATADKRLTTRPSSKEAGLGVGREKAHEAAAEEHGVAAGRRAKKGVLGLPAAMDPTAVGKAVTRAAERAAGVERKPVPEHGLKVSMSAAELDRQDNKGWTTKDTAMLNVAFKVRGWFRRRDAVDTQPDGPRCVSTSDTEHAVAHSEMPCCVAVLSRGTTSDSIPQPERALSLGKVAGGQVAQAGRADQGRGQARGARHRRRGAVLLRRGAVDGAHAQRRQCLWQAAHHDGRAHSAVRAPVDHSACAAAPEHQPDGGGVRFARTGGTRRGRGGVGGVKALVQCDDDQCHEGRPYLRAGHRPTQVLFVPPCFQLSPPSEKYVVHVRRTSPPPLS